MDQLSEEEEILARMPLEIILLVLETTNALPATRWMQHPFGTLEERIVNAGTRPFTMAEAEKLYDYGDGMFIFAHNASSYLVAFSIPGWDDPPIPSGDVVYGQSDPVDGTACYYSGSSELVTAEDPVQAAIGKTIVTNIHHATLDVASGQGVPWSRIPNDLDDPPYTLVFETADYILLDLESIYTLLVERFAIVSAGNKKELARIWTTKAFEAAVARLQSDPLGLFLYLLINRTVVGDDPNWIAYLNFDPEPDNAAYYAEIAHQCVDLQAEILAGIQTLGI